MASEELQEMLGKVQMQNQQLQNVMVQKQSFSVQKIEVGRALKELEKADSDVYKSVGPVLLKTTKEKMKEELEDLQEQIDIKIKGLDRQEKKLQGMMKESQDKLQGMISPSGGGTQAG